MRPEIEAACDEMTRAAEACYSRWCSLLDGKRRQDQAAVVASQEPLHHAAGELRRLCLADPARADDERHELMRLQVEGEVRFAAKARKARSGTARGDLQARWNNDRWRLLAAREAITVGLGWPHRGERVTAAAWHWTGTGQQRYAGPAVCLHSSDTHNVGHQVWAPAISADHRKGTLGVTWEPHEHWGNADPAGDIGLRVAGAEERRLPVPLPRWPEQGDIRDAGPLLAYAPGEQLGLF